MNHDLARAREHLMQVREALLHRQGDHREGEAELLGAREPDPSDAAAAEGGAIPLDSLSDSEQQQVAEIDAALARVTHGEYGACQDCDEKIEARRLEAVPWARRCFPCEMEFEKGHRAVNVV